MKRLLHVDILSVFFGLGTWLCVNGLWVELPLMVQKLPEGWNLPSYLSVAVQIANVGPLLYTLLHSFFPKYVTEKGAIYFVMAIGLATTILLALFWEKTTIIAGSSHSTALLTLVFFLAAVDCSSRVAYLPFMARFNEMYLTSYFIGEGLSGFFPSIIALAQGVGGNPECRNNTFGNGTEPYTPDPRFSVEIFFYTLFAFTLMSLVAFFLLNKENIVSGAFANIPSTLEQKSGSPHRGSSSDSYSSKEQSIFEPPRMPSPEVQLRGRGDPDGDSNSSDSPDRNVRLGFLDDNRSVGSNESTFLMGMSQQLFVYLLVLQVIVCMLSNGIFPSIQSYSCLPYGNVAYHLAVTLSNMANPTVCLLAFFIPPPNKSSITIAAVLSFLLSSWVMATAVLSPKPPLVDETLGEVMLVLSWIILVALFTYVRVSIATILRVRGQTGLFWCGAVTQFGSTIGAIIAFVVVNYTNVFEAYYPCT